MKVIDKIMNYFVLVIYGIWNFGTMIIDSLITLRNCFELIGGILYQPIIFLITILILYSPINSIANVYEQSNSSEAIFPYIIMLVAGMIIIVLVINAFLELMYLIFHAQDRYNTIFAIQQSFYNYSLIVISLIAFWVSYDKSMDATANLELLFIGSFFFLCVIFTDLYSFLIHSKKKVNELYDDILSKKKELFQ
ncbi:hypothetical protein ACTQ32_09815 [Roseburia faecis]|uniref:hypothetical protein n=1 Tax=Roseburia faecis TaxID=301302 RepID=UPI002943A4F4|nr:hypothetical protein [uncultured Agathobacter sp.]